MPARATETDLERESVALEKRKRPREIQVAPITRRHLSESGRFGRCEERREGAQQFFQSSRRNDLEYFRRLLTCVPEHMPLSAWFEDQVTRAAKDLRVPRVPRTAVGGDANYVMIDLEFDSADDAAAVLAALRQHLRGVDGTVLPTNTTPHTCIAEVVDANNTESSAQPYWSRAALALLRRRRMQPAASKQMVDITLAKMRDLCHD